MKPAGTPVLLTFAGTPATRAAGGTSNPSGTRHAAATIAPAPTVTRFSVTEPEPIRQPSRTTQPSRCALCPTTQSAPISVGHSCVQCTTVPSCTDVRAPTSIRPWSPRSTAHGHTDASGPIADPADDDGVRVDEGGLVDLRLVLAQRVYRHPRSLS